MNEKNRQRHLTYEALVILGQFALLTYITRLWPILLVILAGIFIAMIRLLVLSMKIVEPVQPLLSLPAPTKVPTQTDMQGMAYELIQSKITQILLSRYPQVRWVWENPRAREDIMAGNTVYVLLNKAGSYRRGRVVIQQLQVIDVVLESEVTSSSNPVSPSSPKPAPTPVPSPEVQEDDCPEDFGLIAFQWVESHILELNAQCNEAIGEGLTEYLIPEDSLPVSESWDAICQELLRNEFRNAQCCDEGIIIEFEQ